MEVSKPRKPVSKLKMIVDNSAKEKVVKPAEQITTLITIYKNIQGSDNPQDIMQCIDIADGIAAQAIRLKEEAIKVRADHLKKLKVVEVAPQN